MAEDSKLIPIYTTASYVLDLQSAEVLNSHVGATSTGRRIRVVGVRAEEVARQTSLYVASLETALSEHEWKVELQFGNVSETDGGGVTA